MATIRTAKQDDIPAMVAVVNAAFAVEREFRAGERTSAADILRLMEKSAFFVAEEDGQIVGAVQARVKHPAGYFAMLAVDPRVQRGGIGRALREAAENHCRDHGCAAMTLMTGSVRPELVQYYARAGYRITSVQPQQPGAPFTKKFDIVHMAKRLR